ncbi:MAG: hypothetical protein HUK05_07815, partial [Prevotella sp.]|nr:hypothetical protein [Prevotella sp.]
ENNIKGEHIYVAHEEWTMLETMFSFNGIPYAVLAGKDAKVIQNGFEIYRNSVDDLKAIVGRQK